MAKGDPRCPLCEGRGGKYAHGQWHRCQCVRGTKTQREWMSYVNSIGAKNPAPRPKDR